MTPRRRPAPAAPRPPPAPPEAHRPAFWSTNDALQLEWGWLLELTKETSRLRATQRYRDWLNATANHWEYSPFNCSLIVMQKPDAVRVAGRAAWESRGRTVRPDAKPISILAPSGGGRRFVGVVVYDLEDTDGPALKIDSWGQRGTSRHLAATRAAASALRITLERVPPRRGVTGWTRPGRLVAVCEDLPPAEEVATLAHEYGHALLGHLDARSDLPDRIKEGEAEAVAWVVLKSLGVKSKAPEYLLFHGVTPATLRVSFKLVAEVSHRIAGAILGRKKRKSAPVGSEPEDA